MEIKCTWRYSVFGCCFVISLLHADETQENPELLSESQEISYKQKSGAEKSHSKKHLNFILDPVVFSALLRCLLLIWSAMTLLFVKDCSHRRGGQDGGQLYAGYKPVTGAPEATAGGYSSCSAKSSSRSHPLSPQIRFL